MAWAEIDGRARSIADFAAHVATTDWSGWRPSRIVIHNTAIPSLAQRPAGLTRAHLTNLETWYRDTNRWSAGPHLFIDDHAIHGFTPLNRRGVHSPSWNASAIGIELLGDYARESFDGGRGLAVRRLGAAAAALLCAALDIAPEAILFHRDDPRTTHSGCPGRNVVKAELVREVAAFMAGATLRLAA